MASTEHTEGVIRRLSAMLNQLRHAERCFDRACDQILVLEQQIETLEGRYKHAVKQRKNSFRYNLRLKLSVVTGVKMMYHHYAAMKNEDIQEIRRRLEQIRQALEQLDHSVEVEDLR